jgi:hypothetical protein
MMRNIEDLADEEETRIRIMRNAWLAKAFVWFLSVSLAVGWILFGRGNVPAGSLVIVLSLTGLLFRSGIHALLRFKPVYTIFSILVGLEIGRAHV